MLIFAIIYYLLNSLFIKRSTEITIEVFDGIMVPRYDLTTTFEKETLSWYNSATS